MAILEEFSGLKDNFPLGAGYQLITQPEEMAWPDADQDALTGLKIFQQDKAIAMNWVVSQGWVAQWARSEQLYLFKVPIRFWDNSDVPRSSLGMPLVYEHVESVLPQLMAGVFADEPPFVVNPRPGTSADAARANTAILQWQLKQANVREETRLGFKYMLIHGMGIWKLGWECYTKKRKIKSRTEPYQFIATGGPSGGINVAQKGTYDLVEHGVTDEVNLPTFEHRNIRHVLVDPGVRTSDIRKAKYVIDLQYPTILDLDQLRDYEGYNIPSREILMDLMFPPEEVPNYNPLESQTPTLFKEFNVMPRNMNTTVDRTRRPLELAEYWNCDRVVTVLQNRLVIRNEANPFGCIPFLSCAMSDIIDNFWGIGITQLIGNEQRMQQGVINGYLDDFSLNINGMFTRVRGGNIIPQQLRMRPGGVIDMDAKDGVGILPRPALITGDVMTTLQASDGRAARRTAASESAVQGSLPSQNSSITRTATGVNSLASGTGTRLQSIIEQFAHQVFVPMLDMFHKMNAMYLDPQQINKLLTKELGIAYQGDTLDFINGQFDFDVQAAARLQDRAVARQNLPLLFQYLLTQPVMDALTQEGKKINIGELVNTLFDVTGFKNKQNIITDMTPEDEQRAQQNSPAAQQAAQQQAQQQQGQQQQSDKMQLLQTENSNRAGRDVLKELIAKSDKAALGL